MIEPNLNLQNVVSPAPKTATRFDITRHVHQEKPFVTSLKMLLSVLVAGATLAAFLLGGAYLLVGGVVPEFAQVAQRAWAGGASKGSSEGSGEADSPKTLEEETKHFFSVYKDRWNGGAFPSGLASSDFRAFGPGGTKLKGPANFYDGSLDIVALRIPKITRLSDDQLNVDVIEQYERHSTMKKWYAAEKSLRPDPLLVGQVVRLRYGIKRTVGKRPPWMLMSRRWVSTVGGRTIRQADDGEPDGGLGAETTDIEDRRLTEEVLQPRYEAMAAQLSQWEFPVEHTFKSEYKLSYEEGAGEKTPAQLQTRLDRARGHLTLSSVTATLLSVNQTSEVRATAEVKYRAEFTVVGSPNRYIAVWRDRDTWATAQQSGDWYLFRTKRIYRSPLMEHYEELSSTSHFTAIRPIG